MLAEVQKVIEDTVEFVKQKTTGAEGGHDWWHIYRVWHLAKKIAENETTNLLVVELAALLHDIADTKFHNGDENIGPATARNFLTTLPITNDEKEHVINIIINISFKGGNNKQTFRSKELDVVQDADRLDALGAIGIARAFNYGGFKNRKIYDPGVEPNLNMSKEEYKKSEAPTLNHFYEKLLLLKDRMNTETGKKMAESRHQFMQDFLDEFYREWKFEI